MKINITDVKEFLKVGNFEEDYIIQAMLDGAISYCETYLNRPILEENMNDENKWEVPNSIFIAVVLLVSTWYDNRTNTVVGTITKELEYSTHAILSPHRIRSV